MRPLIVLVVLCHVASGSAAAVERAQEPAAPAPLTICNLSVPVPAKEPPTGSGPIVLAMLLCFDKQGGTSAVAPETYLYYIELKPSEPSRDRWVPFDADAARLIRDDFQRLWATGFLDDLTIEAVDYTFANGVVGKVIVVHLEERQRIKLIDYEGASRLSRADIIERLKEKGIELRLDSFVDPGTLRRASTVVRNLYSEKGYQAAEVTPLVRELPGGAKLAHVIFRIVEGPKVAIRDVEFVGNTVFTDAQLAKALKANRAQSLLSLVSDRGTFHEDRLADDVQNVVDHYRNHGYIEARVNQPTLRPLDDSADGQTRWVQLRIDVSEGPRFVVGDVTFDGNAVVASELLRPLFRLEAGETYSQALVVKGFERARELYGAGGYFEFTGYPDLKPRADGPPIVDVTMKMSEGPQYFVNRITFTGNTQTRDQVIRRELGLVEGSVFNTEALKYSVRRLNQLGYFKPLDERAITVDRTTGGRPEVDVTIAVEEQNRHQLNVGAGLSQYDGLFANFSYTTSNFMGRGESATVAIQSGTRADSYQVSFSEPFLLGRPVTAGASLYSRKVDYAVSATTIDYSEARSGFSLTTGVPVRRFTRVFATYGYEVVHTAMADELEGTLGAEVSPGTMLLQEGRFTSSSITPSLVHNTVDNPFAPRTGRRLTLTSQYAGGWLGGTTQFLKPEVEAILYIPLTARTAFGLRANAGRIWNLGGQALPYYQRYFLGGEMQIRGVDVRTVGPTGADNVALGGTTFVLFNAEYYYDLFQRVRALAFHDAGQAYSERDAIDLRQLRTSSGVELRITLPMLNVPFRLIQAWNVYRDSFQPARAFKVSVGTTF